MRLRCRCGNVMNNVASPGHVVHTLLTEHGIERMESAGDKEVRASGGVDWWEAFDAAKGQECWLCPECDRLYVGLNGPHSAVRVYAPEGVGIDPRDTWADMYLLPTGQVWLGPKPPEPASDLDPAKPAAAPPPAVE